MVNDIRVDVRLPRHWKYRKLKSILGISPMENLICFWGTIAEQIPNGALNGWSKKDVELAAEWSGSENTFCDALLESGFLDATKSGFYPHDWAKNQPWVIGAKERSLAAKKAGIASAKVRKVRKIEKPNSTESQRSVDKAFNGMATEGQRNGNPRTPSPSPSPIKAPIQEINNNIYKDETGTIWDTLTGEETTIPF